MRAAIRPKELEPRFSPVAEPQRELREDLGMGRIELAELHLETPSSAADSPTYNRPWQHDPVCGRAARS